MMDVPDEVRERCDAYCHERSLTVGKLRGWGLDGFIWQSGRDGILKVFRHEFEFGRELAVYQRLKSRGTDRLQGFEIPNLLDYDENQLVLELSFVRPPYILDFAGATLGQPRPGFDAEAPEWIAEKQRLFGRHWPDVARLLDALRHLGIHYSDVHAENIRVERRISQ